MLYNKIEHNRGFFICCKIKKSINFPIVPLLIISNQTLFFQRGRVASASICSLIKYAKISQSQPLLKLFKLFDWLKRQQLSVTNWTFGFECFSSEEWPLYREDICLQTLLLLFKYANHKNKRSFEALVGTV